MLNVSETQKMFQEKGIKYFMMSFVDLHGTPRAKLVPAECLSDVVEGAAGFAGFAVDGIGQGPHDPDLSCVPKTDSSVFPLPWKPGWRGSRATYKWTAPIGNTARAPFCREQPNGHATWALLSCWV
jgi:glutamine synthetase